MEQQTEHSAPTSGPEAPLQSEPAQTKIADDLKQTIIYHMRVKPVPFSDTDRENRNDARGWEEVNGRKNGIRMCMWVCEKETPTGALRR